MPRTPADLPPSPEFSSKMSCDLITSVGTFHVSATIVTPAPRADDTIPKSFNIKIVVSR